VLKPAFGDWLTANLQGPSFTNSEQLDIDLSSTAFKVVLIKPWGTVDMKIREMMGMS
jgi:hypothetical protein